jgi:hypothetical protein
VETIESERQLGILKDLKRKKKRVDDGWRRQKEKKNKKIKKNKKKDKKIL